MKLKIVIWVELCCDKCRAKARVIAAAAHGVISVALEGEDKVVVVGVCVDAAKLTCCLRKKFNCVKLLSVEEVKPPPKEPEKKKEPKKCTEETHPICCPPPHPNCCPPKPCCPPKTCCRPPPPTCCPPPDPTCCPPPHCDPPTTCNLM